MTCVTTEIYFDSPRKVNDHHHEILDEEGQADEEGNDANSNGKVAGVRFIVGTLAPIDIITKDLIGHAAKDDDGKQLERKIRNRVNIFGCKRTVHLLPM